MTVTTEGQLIRHELINLKVTVTHSSNPLHNGLNGIVIDETKNTLLIASGSKKRRIPKEGTTYGFTMTDGTFIEVEGELLLGRPADRTRKTFRRKHR